MSEYIPEESRNTVAHLSVEARHFYEKSIMIKCSSTIPKDTIREMEDSLTIVQVLFKKIKESI